MKLIVASMVLLGTTMAARLENTYLPPNSARTAGGSGSFLSTPFGGAGGSISGTYGAPAGTRQYSGSSSGYSGSAGGYSGSTGYSTGQANVRILKLDNDNDGTGNYRFNYETENRISQQEQGTLSGGQEPATIVRGSYSYTSPEGETITVNYVADEFGFRPEGAHLPTPPPIPAEIQRSLQQSASGYSAGGSSGFGGSSTSFGGSSAGPSNQYLTPNVGGGNSGYRY